MSESNVRYTEAEALEFHSHGRPGKIEIVATKPMATQRDLSLAYSPGVAVPVRAIADNPACAYDYTSKGNLVAVISNGTAILGMCNSGALAARAGLINACEITGRKLADIRVVVNGAGAAASACTELVKAMGVRGDHVTMCDRKGVIHKDRTNLDQWKSAHAVETEARTLADACVGADVFLGLSAAGALKPDMVKSMAKEPIIFAMANPVPELWPPEAMEARPAAIIATGRSDFPNQVNN